MVTRHDMDVLATQRRIANAMDNLVESIQRLNDRLEEMILELTQEKEDKKQQATSGLARDLANAIREYDRADTHPGGMHTERHIHPPVTEQEVDDHLREVRGS